MTQNLTRLINFVTNHWAELGLAVAGLLSLVLCLLMARRLMSWVVESAVSDSLAEALEKEQENKRDLIADNRELHRKLGRLEELANKADSTAEFLLEQHEEREKAPPSNQQAVSLAPRDPRIVEPPVRSPCDRWDREEVDLWHRQDVALFRARKRCVRDSNNREASPYVAYEFTRARVKVRYALDTPPQLDGGHAMEPYRVAKIIEDWVDGCVFEISVENERVAEFTSLGAEKTFSAEPSLCEEVFCLIEKEVRVDVGPGAVFEVRAKPISAPAIRQPVRCWVEACLSGESWSPPPLVQSSSEGVDPRALWGGAPSLGLSTAAVAGAAEAPSYFLSTPAMFPVPNGKRQSVRSPIDFALTRVKIDVPEHCGGAVTVTLRDSLREQDIFTDIPLEMARELELLYPVRQAAELVVELANGTPDDGPITVVLQGARAGSGSWFDALLAGFDSKPFGNSRFVGNRVF